MTAACVCAAEGLRVLLVEKTGRIGGTTAISGGMVWLPANAKMRLAGLADSSEQAAAYLDATVPGEDNAAARSAFLSRCNEALDYLERRTSLLFRPVIRYPDYYQSAPGSTTGGRVLEPVPFEGTRLGRYFNLLRSPLPEFTLFGGMMIDRADIPHFRRIGRSIGSTLRILRLVLRHAWQRARHPRGTSLVLGNALAARLLRSVLDLQVDVMLDTEVLELLTDKSQIRGVTCVSDGVRKHIVADRAVVLATGGFSHDPAGRANYLPQAAGPYSAVPDSNTGDGMRAGAAVGAATPTQRGGNAFWVPVSVFRRKDGSQAVFPHTVTDRAKPGAIVINQEGRRFLNEAVSYHEFVRALIGANASGSAIPSYLICDRDFIWSYGLGAVKPFTMRLSPYLRSGYLVSASTLEELAGRLHVPEKALAETVSVFNSGAVEGLDPAFGRGGDAYQRHMGDADHKPNPCVAPIVRAPFFALALYPGDLGTAAGLATNEKAQVLDSSGRVIPNLYACGNDMHSVMNGAYPGPGITLGPALVFGYIAGRNIAAAERNARGADV